MQALLTIETLSKTYERGPESVHALRGVDLELMPGELVALVGRSGSGKTTLLNIIAGWEEPTAGTLLWDVAGTIPTDWADVAVVPQRLGLLEELTVRENVELPFLKARELPATFIDEMLGDLGLTALAERYPWEISIGEQQRTAVGRALVVGPRLLLLDEPTGHQDPGSAERLMERVRVETARGTCCVVATHSRETVTYADRVIGIEDGLVSDGRRPARVGAG